MSKDIFIIRMSWTDDAVWERLFVTKAAVVADIITGQVPANEITAILHCDPEEHICDDVLETIARAVAFEAKIEQHKGGDVTRAVYDFVHDYAGSEWAHGLRTRSAADQAA